MIVKNVDLYQYFGIKKEDGYDGRLTVILHENSWEINTERKYPAMLVLPGGGYAMCSDREAEPIAERYFTNGYNTFILRYSNAPARYPVQLCEAAMAMAYIRRNADEQHTDAHHVAAVGFSAGGHLCGHISTCYGSNEILTRTGITAEEARPDAAILSYAVINPTIGFTGAVSFTNLCCDDPEILPLVTIDKHVTKDTPPLFIWHTSNDACVDVRNSFAIASAANENGVPYCLHIFTNGQHGLSTANRATYSQKNMPAISPYAENWLEMSVSWLKEFGFYYVD